MKKPFGTKEDKNKLTQTIPPYSFPVLRNNTYNDKRSYLNHVEKIAELWAQEIIESYVHKQKPVRDRAKLLRHLALICGSIGGLIPLLIGTGISNVLINFNLIKEINWIQDLNWIKIGYLSLGMAAVFVSYDKIFGYSSSWIRFVQTTMALRLLLGQFQIEWAAKDSEALHCELDVKQCDDRLQMIKSFVVEILSEVKNEASKWAVEYNSSIAELESTYNQPNNKK